MITFEDISGHDINEIIMMTFECVSGMVIVMIWGYKWYDTDDFENISGMIVMTLGNTSDMIIVMVWGYNWYDSDDL